MSYVPDISRSNQQDLERITAIHRYKRPKGSRMEQQFCDTFIAPLGVQADLYGNLHKVVTPQGAAENYRPQVLWSCHTDTVHHSEGWQRVKADANGMISLADGETSNCLGADDGAGIWLMSEMIRAGVPGHYIFHYGEEKGCEGSTKISEKASSLLKDIQIAIAFDRKNCFDVITKMQGLKVCSDEFAKSLIAQLPTGYKTETGGSRTDVALYRKFVRECTNISVGYHDQHNNKERLDTSHLIDLRDALVKIDVTKLIVRRDCSEADYTHTTHHRGMGHHNTNAYRETRPRSFKDLFRDAPSLCEEMMVAAGVDFDTFLSLALKQQKTRTNRNYHAFDKEVLPYYDYKDPIPDHPGVVAAATPPAPPKTETQVAETAPSKAVVTIDGCDTD